MPAHSIPEAESERLRHFRLASHLTLSQAAQKSGLSKSEISKLESGARRVRTDHLYRLAKIYNTPPRELAGPASDLNALLGANGEATRAVGDDRSTTLPVYTTAELSADQDGAREASRVAAPIQLRGNAAAYAVEVADMSLDPPIPPKAVLFVDPTDRPRIGDMVINRQTYQPVVLHLGRSDAATLMGIRLDTGQEYKLSRDDLDRLHRVVGIWL